MFNKLLISNDVIHLKQERIPKKYRMILFDVKCLFKNLLLDENLSIILRKIYNEAKMETNIPRKSMKKLLLLCTKHAYFAFNGDIYIHLGGVVMGSQLGPLLANFFMFSINDAIVLKLVNCYIHWKRYVVIHAYVDPDKTDYVMRELNS